MKKFFIALFAAAATAASAFPIPFPAETMAFTATAYEVQDNIVFNSKTGTWTAHLDVEFEPFAFDEVPGVRGEVIISASAGIDVTRAEIAAFAGVTEDFVSNEMGGAALRSNITAVAIGKADDYFGF